MKKISLMAFSALVLFLLIVPFACADDGENVSIDDDNATDYYFNINAEIDGDGLKDSPYSNFTDERIRDNSTVHLANGEYAFEKSRLFNNISFYGENPQKTILNGNGNELTINGTVTFQNITLTNFKIVNTANLTAKNVIFTGLIPSHPEKDSNNYYGGAIFAQYNKNIFLENCSFKNNTAHYGGAIYACGGNLIILNSIFYNNGVNNFAGAILGESGVRIIINNTEFKLNNAENGSGGAIYIVSSSLTANNITLTDSKADFGAGIVALKSNLVLNDSVFENNHARYEGGAVYEYYGSINVNSSRFIANTARSGAGIFMNDVNIINITSNEFTGNAALNYGGAIYSGFSNTFNETSNLFNSNSAGQFNDTYTVSNVNLTLGDGNYTLYMINQTANITIPASYDLRNLGLLTPVKDQENGGNCWAFAALTALESCILKASGEVVDLSEGNMKNLMAWYSDYGRNIRSPNDGGDNDMPIAYLVSWMGPVSEEDESYDDKSHLSSVLHSLMHVQNVLFLKRNNFTDNDGIKQAIMKYGAVATTMFFSNMLTSDVSHTKICQYYTGDEPTNHAVTIVGWDDSVRIPGAPGPGAWIVRNSWGPNWLSQYGCDGYFYVSYYDNAFARPGNFASYTFILNDTQHFDKNYQYDISGITDYFWNGVSSVWYENAFHASDNEFLKAVSTYFNKDTQWELNIYVNSKLQLVQKGSAVPGYFTFNLDYPIPLVKGDLFEIMFKIKVEGDVAFPISEAVSLTKYTYSPGVSFVSYNNGQSWHDLYNLEWFGYPGHNYVTQVACIKGFTELTTLNSTIKTLNITYDSLDIFNITVNLADEFNNTVRNGNVTFTVNGKDYNVTVWDGLAKIQLPFVLGLNNISCVFKSPNYYSAAANATFELKPLPVNMNITVKQDFNNAVVNFTFEMPINEDLNITINNDTMVIRTINGTASINLTDLEYGDYIITAHVDNEKYDSANSTSFFVNVKKTHLDVYDVTTVYNSGLIYQVILTDEFGDAVAGREIVFDLNGTIYKNITDDNGKANLILNLKEAIYKSAIVFNGDDNYIKCENTSIITVKSSVYLPEIKTYTLNSNYEAKLLDRDGNPLNNTQITVTINNMDYSVETDENGQAIFAIHLNDGKYNISIKNPSTGQVLSQDIDIVKRITENRNVSVYYGSNPTYRVRVCDDYGEFAKDLEVKVTLNAKIYYLKTDSNGYVSLKISLNPGKYTITSEYKGFKTSSKINIKTTLITKNKSFKKGKNIKYTAKLLDNKGKILKNKKITFKIKGKTYKAKTNKKGIATIKIKNLKRGKYTVTIKYAKLTNRNKITVKK